MRPSHGRGTHGEGGDQPPAEGARPLWKKRLRHPGGEPRHHADRRGRGVPPQVPHMAPRQVADPLARGAEEGRGHLQGDWPFP